jgi:hypothetical protein
MEESEAWRKEGEEQPWTEVKETGERFVLQLDLKALGTMMIMLGSNLATSNVEDTKEKSLKLVENFIERWKYIEN